MDLWAIPSTVTIKGQKVARRSSAAALYFFTFSRAEVLKAFWQVGDVLVCTSRAASMYNAGIKKTVHISGSHAPLTTKSAVKLLLPPSLARCDTSLTTGSQVQLFQAFRLNFPATFRNCLWPHPKRLPFMQIRA